MLGSTRFYFSERSSNMPDWLHNILHQVEVAADKQATFDQLVLNERNHGLGLTAPEAIDEALVTYKSDIDAVIAGAHRTTGAVWKLGRTLVGNAVRARSTAQLRA